MPPGEPEPRSSPSFPCLPPNVRALGWVSFFNDTGSEMIYPLLPLFLTAELGASPLLMGAVEGLAEAVASLTKLLSGWLSDRLCQRKRLLEIGYLLATLTRPLIALARQPWHILVLRASDRLGKGIRTSPRDALLADSTSEEIRGRSFGFHRAMDHAGAVAGPLLASSILWLWPAQYRRVFALAVLPSLLALLALFRGVREIPPRRREEALPLHLTLQPFERSFKLFLLVLLLFTLGNSSDAFLLLRAHELGIPATGMPLLWIALHTVKSLASTWGGSLSDRWGRRKVIALGWLLYTAVYLGLGFAEAAWQAWALFAIYGLYFGLTEGAEKALVADWAPTSLRGMAYGWYHLILGGGLLPASLLCGGLYQRWGAAAAFTVGAGLAGLASLLLMRIRPTKETR